MIPKNLNQMTIKRTKNGVTGSMGLSRLAHSLKHYGVEKILDRHFPIKCKSRRAIAGSRKIMEGALTLIAGGGRLRKSAEYSYQMSSMQRLEKNAWTRLPVEKSEQEDAGIKHSYCRLQIAGIYFLFGWLGPAPRK